MSFCAFLILKMEGNIHHFQHIMLYYFKKGKNATETLRKGLCSVWRSCCDWSNVSKVVYEVSFWRVLAGWCSTVGQTSWSWEQSNRDTNWEQSTFYHAGDSQHTQNIQSNKVIGENEKCIFYFTEKPYRPFGQPHRSQHTPRAASKLSGGRGESGNGFLLQSSQETNLLTTWAGTLASIALRTINFSCWSHLVVVFFYGHQAN